VPSELRAASCENDRQIQMAYHVSHELMRIDGHHDAARAFHNQWQAWLQSRQFDLIKRNLLSGKSGSQVGRDRIVQEVRLGQHTIVFKSSPGFYLIAYQCLLVRPSGWASNTCPAALRKAMQRARSSRRWYRSR